LLVGIAVGRLDEFVVAELTGAIPDNVAFAIRAEMVETFMRSRGLDVEGASPRTELKPVEVGKQSNSFVAKVECWQ